MIEELDSVSVTLEVFPSFLIKREGDHLIVSQSINKARSWSCALKEALSEFMASYWDSDACLFAQI